MHVYVYVHTYAYYTRHSGNYELEEAPVERIMSTRAREKVQLTSRTG